MRSRTSIDLDRPSPTPSQIKRHRSVAFAVLVALSAMCLAAGASTDRDDTAPPNRIDLALYAEILETHTRVTQDVTGVRVDYAGIGASPKWKQLVDLVKKSRPSRLDRRGSMAYWINAYNILTIDLIVSHYPVDDIRDIGSFFSPVWDIEVATIEDKPVSLGHIEHEILRPMGDPRIHAAIVCASTSCPPLSRRPFDPKRLDEDLDVAMRAWLSNRAKGVHVDANANHVTVSKIFDWFEKDFEASGGPIAFIAQYVDAETAAWLRGRGHAATPSYFRYDWSLNDIER